ncbi:unnamed protein product [Linum tenue]|uniref:Uncharacterized protein n=1 Tax=Linum tenue TaxID=586396 RepID=A0AAV0HDP5_9ROSI|nr:unnamed protein product [Linum tenue]
MATSPPAGMGFDEEIEEGRRLRLWKVAPPATTRSGKKRNKSPPPADDDDREESTAEAEDRSLGDGGRILGKSHGLHVSISGFLE